MNRQNPEDTVKRSWRPRFSLQTLALGLALLAFLLAVNVSTGEYSYIPPNVFLPGLLSNVAAEFCFTALVFLVLTRIQKAPEIRSR